MKFSRDNPGILDHTGGTGSMKPFSFSILARIIVLAVMSLAAGSASGLPRSTPEAQGVSSATLLQLIESADARIEGIHSFMLVRHGHVIAEGWWAPYAANLNHRLYSLSKSFTSTAVGLAVAEGKLSIDDPVVSFFPDALPDNPSDFLPTMRVRDLLTMSTGHQDEPSAAPNVVSAKSFLAHPVPHKPGTHFKYNTAATFMLSAIVQKQTGQTVADFLKPRLFQPLDIANPLWETNWQGISLGGYGLRIRTEDIARFGQLYLQKGRWHGQQLIPEKWIEMATARQTSNGSNPNSDWEQGYGFQFWRCRHNAYRGDGAFGQFCLVMPDQDAVVAITSGLGDMQAVLNLIWDQLLPAFHPAPLPDHPQSQNHLKNRLARLTLHTPNGTASSPLASQHLGRRYTVAENDRQVQGIRLEPGPSPESTTLILTSNGNDLRFPCGYQQWLPCPGQWTELPGEPAAASGAWSDKNTFTARLCFYQTPYTLDLSLQFEGDQVTCRPKFNVWFGPTQRPTLTGTARPVP